MLNNTFHFNLWSIIFVSRDIKGCLVFRPFYFTTKHHWKDFEFAFRTQDASKFSRCHFFSIAELLVKSVVLKVWKRLKSSSRRWATDIRNWNSWNCDDIISFWNIRLVATTRCLHENTFNHEYAFRKSPPLESAQVPNKYVTKASRARSWRNSEFYDNPVSKIRHSDVLRTSRLLWPSLVLYAINYISYRDILGGPICRIYLRLLYKLEVCLEEKRAFIQLKVNRVT